MYYLKKNNITIIVLLLILLLPSIWSLFRPGLFVSDDASWMVIRFSAFYEALKDGQIPVRFLSRLNYGYGYPVANFLYPGFMYLATPLHILGLNFQESIKVVLGLSMIFSGLFSYFWLSKLFGRLPSFIASIFYVYAPYHLYDLYRRGSVGEVLALAIVPFVMWQAERKSILFTALGIFFLILSHNSLAALFLPIVLVYLLLDIYISKKRKEAFFSHGVSFIGGTLMSSFFSLPSIFELKNTVFSQTKISNFNEYFTDFELTGAITLLIFITFIVFLYIKKIDISKHRLSVIFFAFGVVSLFFSSQLSSFLWDILPVSFIQFPFRLLSIVILSGAFLLAFLLSMVPKERISIVGLVVSVVIIASSLTFITPKEYVNYPDEFYSTNESTTTVHDEYMPIWVKDKPTTHASEKITTLDKGAVISNQSLKSNKINFNYLSLGNSKVYVNTIYYPGWKAFVNGQEANINYSNPKGVMEIDLPDGSGEVLIKFTETNFRMLANFISIITFILLIFFSLKFKNLKNEI